MNEELEVKTGLFILTMAFIGMCYTGYLAYKGIKIILSYIWRRENMFNKYIKEKGYKLDNYMNMELARMEKEGLLFVFFKDNKNFPLKEEYIKYLKTIN